MKQRERPASRVVVTILGVVAVLVAAGLIGTRLTDSRSPDRGTGVTVGDLHADLIRIRVNGVRSAEVTPIHAGDLITLAADVTTHGPASQWIRTRLDVSQIDPGLAPHISIYNGVVPTGVALKAAMDVTDPITFPGYVGTADALSPVSAPATVLNGERETEAAGVTPYSLAVAMYVDPKTPQRLLDRAVALTAIVQTVPYRANPDAPADDQWVDGPRLALG